jgi:hypothetical protein
LRQESIDDPYVDIVTSHQYPGGKDPKELLDHLRTNRAMAKGNKPYFVGEFGFFDTDLIAQFLDIVIEEDICGALIWSLRFRNRDGGFYWHSEPMGSNLFKAYHWPGFASGDAYDEASLLRVMREKAFAIRGLPVPPLAGLSRGDALCCPTKA